MAWSCRAPSHRLTSFEQTEYVQLFPHHECRIRDRFSMGLAMSGCFGHTCCEIPLRSVFCPPRIESATEPLDGLRTTCGEDLGRAPTNALDRLRRRNLGWARWHVRKPRREYQHGVSSLCIRERRPCYGPGDRKTVATATNVFQWSWR